MSSMISVLYGRASAVAIWTENVFRVVLNEKESIGAPSRVNVSAWVGGAKQPSASRTSMGRRSAQYPHDASSKSRIEYRSIPPCSSVHLTG